MRKELREMVVFAPQNVLQDPPFSKLDIITCRNLLIYLEPDMQKRVLALLHFGLREGGTLMLGNSETVSGVEELFQPIDKKWRLFRRMGATRHGMIEFPLPVGAADRDREIARPIVKPSVAHLTHRALLDRHTPAAVTVDREYHVVFFHGDLEPYITHPAGEPTRDLLALVRESFRGAVRGALQQAASQGGLVTVRGGIVESEKGRRRVYATVEPLDARQAPGYFVVTFDQRAEPASMPTAGGGGDGLDVRQLRDELDRTRDELQSTIEELQSSNEELKASNEEVTSVNEELQSTNEELETSKGKSFSRSTRSFRRSTRSSRPRWTSWCRSPPI